MDNLTSSALTSHLARTRVLVVAAIFTLAFLLIDIRTIDTAIAYKSLRITQFSYYMLLLTAIIYAVGLPVLLISIYESALNSAILITKTKEDNRQDSIAIEMLIDRINNTILGKIFLMCIFFCSIVLFILDYFRSIEIVIIIFVAIYTINAISNDISIANRIRLGIFPDSEADARDILAFIASRRESDDNHFDDRPLSPTPLRKRRPTPEGKTAPQEGL